MTAIAMTGAGAIAPTSSASAAAVAAPQPAGPDSAANAMVGTWEGTFTCGQGLTGLDLRIGQAGTGSSLTATFSFYPLPSNPSVPTGIFTMRGTYQSAARVVLTYSHWVLQPPGGVMVSLAGARSGDRFRGHVTSAPGGAGCTTFSVTKLTGSYTRSKVVGTWKGSYLGCGQGPTGLRLAIKPKRPAGNLITATFSFYALPSNPSVRSGRFAMAGYYFPGGVVLYQVKWIRQPPGYAMVNLVGGPPRSGHLTGAVVGCAAFSLRRS